MRSEELRIAKTESLFRHVNERIAASAEDVGVQQAEVVCECGDPDCGRRLEVLLEDYEATRASGTQFLVAPGHEDPEFEQVVRSLPGYRVVAKLEAAGDVARRLDPRR